MGTLHHAVSVRDFSSKTTYLWKKIDSYYFVRTLSGHTWSTTKKFSILNLSSLHPYGKPYLGYTARQWFALLSDGSRCLTTAHNYSATHHGGRTMSLTARLCSHLLGQAQDGIAQRVQGARGLAVGVRPQIPMADHMGCAPRDGPAHKMKPCGARLYSAPFARHR